MSELQQTKGTNNKGSMADLMIQRFGAADKDGGSLHSGTTLRTAKENGFSALLSRLSAGPKQTGASETSEATKSVRSMKLSRVEGQQTVRSYADTTAQQRSVNGQTEDEMTSKPASNKPTTGEVEEGMKQLEENDESAAVKEKDNADVTISPDLQVLLDFLSELQAQLEVLMTKQTDDSQTTDSNLQQPILISEAVQVDNSLLQALQTLIQKLQTGVEGATEKAEPLLQESTFLTETTALQGKALLALFQKLGIPQDTLESAKATMDISAQLTAQLRALAAGLKGVLMPEAEVKTPELLPDVPVVQTEEPALAQNTLQEPVKETDKKTAPTEKTVTVPTLTMHQIVTTVLSQTFSNTGGQTFAAAERLATNNFMSESAAVKQSNFSAMLEQMKPESVTGQITSKLHVLAETGRHEMELSLKPESLGKINLKLVEEKGQILARFTAESEQVRAILESNMQLLKDALEKNGLQVQQLSVSVGDKQKEQDQTHPNAHKAGQVGRRNGIASGADETVAGIAESSGKLRAYLNGPDSTINFKV